MAIRIVYPSWCATIMNNSLFDNNYLQSFMLAWPVFVSYISLCMITCANVDYRCVAIVYASITPMCIHFNIDLTNIRLIPKQFSAYKISRNNTANFFLFMFIRWALKFELVAKID